MNDTSHRKPLGKRLLLAAAVLLGMLVAAVVGALGNLVGSALNGTDYTGQFFAAGQGFHLITK